MSQYLQGNGFAPGHPHPPPKLSPVYMYTEIPGLGRGAVNAVKQHQVLEPVIAHGSDAASEDELQIRSPDDTRLPGAAPRLAGRISSDSGHTCTMQPQHASMGAERAHKAAHFGAANTQPDVNRIRGNQAHFLSDAEPAAAPGMVQPMVAGHSPSPQPEGANAGHSNSYAKHVRFRSI
jgi:hypothetical protein